MPMRKSYSPSFKAEVVIALLREDKPLSRIASEVGVSPSLLSRWKATAIENMKSLFADEERSEEALKAAHERELKELYAEIGKLNTQLSWLKKRTGINRVQG